MELSPDICYRAMKSRDARFDGRFFVGVVTTGIYCRPVCPAPKPKRQNVRYYPCAAAAAEAGFRPCLRCRPEASPGTPAWIGSSTTVTRALRMIGDGVLDRGNVDELAARLGMGSRNLRRLFLTHLGASPNAVALTRRVHFAKTLLDTTALPVTDIAYSAGFSSIRRFNDAFKKTFGRSPQESRTARLSGSDDGTAYFEMRLPYRTPFAWSLMVGFLTVRAIPGVEIVDREVYRRTVTDGEASGIIEIEPATDAHQLIVRIPVALARRASEIAERVRRLFDLGAFPAEIAEHLGDDRTIGPLVKRFPGLRVPGAWDPFETSVRAVLGQQVSVKAATTVAGRIVEQYGTRLDLKQAARDRKDHVRNFATPTGVTVDASSPSPRYAFPRPERLARARLRRIGIPSGRATAVRQLARAFCDGRVRFDGSMEFADIVDAMTGLDGIGPWTAHYVSMRAGGEPDAFPSGDLALRRAAERRDKSLHTEAALKKRAEAWRPWRSYATMYLWTDYTAQLQKGKKQ
jgi:AraC family transcriptional regulator of adaptative response / DNA-3-methyladenine glycosylase II